MPGVSTRGGAARSLRTHAAPWLIVASAVSSLSSLALPGAARAQDATAPSSAGGGGSGSGSGSGASSMSSTALPATTPSASALGGIGIDVGGAPASRLPLTVVPSFGASQSYTRSDAATPGVQRSNFVTELTPGLRVSSGSGRVRGFFDYALHALGYEGHVDSGGTGDRSNVQQSLSSRITAEAIPNFAFVDASASISQQSASAFGQPFASSVTNTANRNEVRSFTVTPYLRGSFASGLVDYDARASYSGSSSSAATVSDNHQSGASVQLRSGSEFRVLRWSLTANREAQGFDAGRSTESDRLDASLGYAITPQFNVSVHGGTESNDYQTLDKQRYTTSGIGASWRPSEVTSLVGNVDRRAFGNTHSLNFSHRTGRTVWTYDDTRGVSTGIGQPGTTSLGSNYDIVFQLLESLYPDPVVRDQQTRLYLNARGLNPSTVVLGGVLASGLTVSRRQSLAVAWQGVRQTVTLTYLRSEASRLDTLTPTTDDISAAGALRQQGFTLNVSHRLTPTAALVLSGSQQRTQAASSGLTGRFSSVDLGWSDQIGRRTRASLGARRSQYRGTNTPYTESALTAGVTLQF